MPCTVPLLDARGGIVALRAAVGLFEDPDVKLRTWAAQSVQRWHPSPDGRRGDAEVGELLDRADIFSAITCCAGASGKPRWTSETAPRSRSLLSTRRQVALVTTRLP